MDIKARREEIRLEIAKRLFYNYVISKGWCDLWDEEPDSTHEIYLKQADGWMQKLSSLGVMLVDKEAELPGHIPCRGLNPEVTLEQYQSLLHDIFRFLTVEDSYVKAYPLEGK